VIEPVTLLHHYTMEPVTLYHYTDARGIRAILQEGKIRKQEGANDHYTLKEAVFLTKVITDQLTNIGLFSVRPGQADHEGDIAEQLLRSVC
jgi:hypothetical protein